MEFNNLRRQILVNLGHKWRETNSKRSFDLETLRSEFADIPEDDLSASLQSLEDEGYIRIPSDWRTISLTHKGMDPLRIIYTDRKDEEIIVAEKLS